MREQGLSPFLERRKVLDVKHTRFNQANYYVQDGNGTNRLRYNPIGTNRGGGISRNQQCYLVPNSGAGNFGTLQETGPQRPVTRLAVFRALHLPGQA